MDYRIFNSENPKSVISSEAEEIEKDHLWQQIKPDLIRLHEIITRKEEDDISLLNIANFISLKKVG